MIRPSVRNKIVIPAKAGIHFSTCAEADEWFPAFAGMTSEIRRFLGLSLPRRRA